MLCPADTCLEIIFIPSPFVTVVLFGFLFPDSHANFPSSHREAVAESDLLAALGTLAVCVGNSARAPGKGVL